uniref:DNA-directed RNA polymerase n=1 Tax=viral metagenome TaxID=1070528 RepID=A0A6C0ETF4_9ZZZZ
MDEKYEYPSDIDSEIDSDTENVLELPVTSKINNKTTNMVNDDSDEDEDYDNDDENESMNSEDDIYETENTENAIEKNSYNIDNNDNDDDDEDDEDDDENYLQKFNENIKRNIISDYHPELQFNNYEEIENLTTIIRNENGTIVDPLHKTLPFLTKYEKTRILGERTHQINSGSKPFIPVESNIIDGYLIALAELEQKKIPFIIKRPLPNGGCEYWKLKDLEII